MQTLLGISRLVRFRPNNYKSVILYPCCGYLLYTGFGDNTELFPRRDRVTLEGVKLVADYNYFCPDGTMDYLFLCSNSKFKIT